MDDILDTLDTYFTTPTISSQFIIAASCFVFLIVLFYIMKLIFEPKILGKPWLIKRGNQMFKHYEQVIRDM